MSGGDVLYSLSKATGVASRCVCVDWSAAMSISVIVVVA